jgi:hypothetical protein
MINLHAIGVGESARSRGPGVGDAHLDVSGEASKAADREAASSVSRPHDKIRRRCGEEDDGEGKDEAPVNWCVKSVQP